MLEEEEKDRQLLRPRPPTIIERKNVNGGASGRVSPPTVAYPYTDAAPSGAVTSPSAYGGHDQHQYQQLGAGAAGYSGPSPIQGAYGAQAQFDQGYGAPPIPGAHGPGSYAAYGAAADPRYAGAGGYGQGYVGGQYHQQQHQNQNYAGYQGGYAHEGQPQQRHNPSANVPAANPISQRQTHADFSPSSNSPPAPSTATLTRNTGQSGRSEHVTGNREGAEAPPAYDQKDVGKYVDLNRDEKGPGKPRAGANGNGGTAVAAPAQTQSQTVTGQRPTSTYTLYDQDDAYGGM